MASAHINKWLTENHDEIQRVIGTAFNAIENTAKNITRIIGDIVEDSKKIAEYAVAFGKDTWEMMIKAWEKAEKVATWIYEHTPHDVNLPGVKGLGEADNYLLDEEGIPMDEFFGKFWENLGKTFVDDLGKASFGLMNFFTLGLYGLITGRDIHGNPKVKDGIIRPGGQITQVDSNDWVLAFKNLGDVAGAFHAGDRSGGTANVTISQTFQIGGNVRDLPGTIKEQAYRGTSSAIGEMFQNTARIVQLMPATR